MLDRIWDVFVDTFRAAFMPLVCCYHTFSSDLFFNVAAQDATGLEWVGNTLLGPLQYLMAGRVAVLKDDGSWEFELRFNYQNAFWIKTASCVVALPASFILGTATKGLSLLQQETRERLASMKISQFHSHLAEYREAQLDIDSPPSFEVSKGHLRRPGDENVLAVEKQAMKEIATLLNEAKIPWWLDCGTLMGAYRYGGVIPWDDDIDMAVLLNDFSNVLHVLKKLDPKKYFVQDWSTRDFPSSFIKVYVRETGMAIDIYHYEILKEKKQLQYVFSLDNHLLFPEWFKIRERRFKVPVAFETVFPLNKMLFDGVEVFVPHDTQKFLERCYGENLSPAKIYDPQTGRYEKDLSHPYWQRAYVH